MHLFFIGHWQRPNMAQLWIRLNVKFRFYGTISSLIDPKRSWYMSTHFVGYLKRMYTFGMRYINAIHLTGYASVLITSVFSTELWWNCVFIEQGLFSSCHYSYICIYTVVPYYNFFLACIKTVFRDNTLMKREGWR